MFSLDWDKGLLQATIGSLDDKQEKKNPEPFVTGYFPCLFSTSSKASPSAFPEEGWHSIHTHFTCPWDPSLCVCISYLHLCFRKTGGEVALPTRFSVRERGTVI